MTLRDAVDVAATGDVWLFRGRSVADRAIRLFTNSPVNHVGMVLAIDDLPPLIWHAELGASMPNVWTGERDRGAQLHRLDRAVSVWTNRYGQQPWFRQIDIDVTDDMENAALSVVAEYSGRGFPSTKTLARHWLAGRVRRHVSLTDVYCAELVAVTYERMGLLGRRPPTELVRPGHVLERRPSAARRCRTRTRRSTSPTCRPSTTAGATADVRGHDSTGSSCHRRRG